MTNKETSLNSIDYSTANNKRELYPDILRIIASILVITLHGINTYFTTPANYGADLWWITVFINEITRVGVPLFFMLSGYLLLSDPKTEDVFLFYKKRFSKLIIPFLAASILYYVYYRLLLGEPVFSFLFIKQFFNKGTAHHLWYFYSIFLMYLLFPFIKMILKSCEGKRHQVLLTLMLLFLFTFQVTIKPFINAIVGDSLYFYLSDDGITGYFGYALLGYILGHYRIKKPLGTVIILLGIASFVSFSVLNGNNILIERKFIWNGGYTINHYLEAAAVFVCAKALFSQDFAQKHPRLTKISAYLSSLTFSVYLIHIIVLAFSRHILTPVLRIVSVGVYLTLTIIATLVISFSLSAIWKTVSGYLKKKKLQLK